MPGNPIEARTAAERGSVNRVVPADRLDDATLDLLHATRGTSISKGIGTQAFSAPIDLDPPKAHPYAVEIRAAARQIPDAREGAAAFLQKRPAAFTAGGPR
jgi:enoyl-CoA hydratase/carnithine racemase